MSTNQAMEGAWIEAISLFEHARSGDHLGGMQLLKTSADPTKVVHGMVRMLAMFLRTEDPKKVDQFLDASFRAGAPPLGNPFAQFDAQARDALAGALGRQQSCGCDK